MSDERTSRSLSLTTGGITLLGVLLSIGVTVGFGVEGPWWMKILVGAGVTAVLTVAFKVGTAAGRGPIARLANWVIGEPQQRSGAGERKGAP